jgi:hypothetical protein
MEENLHNAHPCYFSTRVRRNEADSSTTAQYINTLHALPLRTL